MRLVGLVDSARSLVPQDHLCWAYQDRAEFRVRALEYMTDGIAAGQRIAYVGSGSAEQLRAELAGIQGITQALDDGDVEVSSVGDFHRFYCHSGAIDQAAAIAASVSTAAQEAIAAGYTGFRAVVDATELVRTPEQREEFARFEYLLDRQMSVLPVTGLCAYDVSVLGSAAVAELACLHPLASRGSTLFRLYADQDADFALAGEFDLACAELFDTTLGRVVPLSSGPELVVNGRAVAFIDHRRLLTLTEHARRAGATVVLQTGLYSVAQVIKLLDLKDVRVEVPA